MNFKFLKIGLVALLLFVSLLPINANNCKAESREIYVNGSYFGYSEGTAVSPIKPYNQQ